MRSGTTKILSALAISVVLFGPAGAHAADPTTSDCLTAAEASIDLRTAHKLRDARAQLLVCAEMTCPTDVRVECRRRLDEVNALIPTVVFQVKDSAGNDLSGVKVTMDGLPLSDRLAGTPVSLDPGEHSFVFEAPWGAKVEKTLALRDGEKDRREPVVFGDASPAQRSANGPESQNLGGGVGGRASTVGHENGRRTLGYALGGAGVAAIAIGSVFGLAASSSWSRSKSECASSGTPCPDHAAALSDHDRAVTAGNVATAGFIAGGALLGGSIALLLTSRSSSSRSPRAAGLVLSPSVGPTTATLSFGGPF